MVNFPFSSAVLPVGPSGELSRAHVDALKINPPAFDPVDLADGFSGRLERLEALVDPVTGHAGPIAHRDAVADLMLAEIRGLQVLSARAHVLLGQHQQ